MGKKSAYGGLKGKNNYVPCNSCSDWPFSKIDVAERVNDRNDRYVSDTIGDTVRVELQIPD